MDKDKRFDFAIAVYEFIERNTSSFELDHIGEDLAYLLGAILKDTRCLWPEDRPIVQLVKDTDVMQFIDIEHP